MTQKLDPPRATVTGLLTVLLLGGCELALHEVQQAQAVGCDPWQTGCPAVVSYVGTEPGPAGPRRVDPRSLEVVSAASDAPYRQCDTVGLVCQGRIIGDVLWDQYVMVLAGSPQQASTAANTRRAAPGGAPGAEPAAVAPATPQPASTPGRVVRTHGTRAEESTTAVPRR